MCEMFKGANTPLKPLGENLKLFSEQIIFNNEACYTLFVIALRWEDLPGKNLAMMDYFGIT
jgi:hypothetical protein